MSCSHFREIAEIFKSKVIVTDLCYVPLFKEFLLKKLMKRLPVPLNTRSRFHKTEPIYIRLVQGLVTTIFHEMLFVCPII